MDPNREPLRKIPVVAVPPVSGDIGSALRARREAKGLSLDTVGRQTRIPKKFLEAMEKNQLDEFPALVYLRGFLKSYCEHLELDFNELWALVQPPLAPATAESPAPVQASPAPQTTTTKAGWRPGAFLLAAALALMLALALRQSAPERVSVPAVSEAPAALAPLSVAAQPTLSIVFRREAWISLKADGMLLFEGRAPQGARQEWKAKKGFALSTPQPQNIELILNSTPYRLPEGPAGEYKIE